MITYTGTGGATRQIKVYYVYLNSALRAGYQLRTYASLFPELNNASSSSYFNTAVVSSVQLPNGQTYRFKYNEYGELARVELPTGGAYEYDYVAGSGVVSGYIVGEYDVQIHRRVAEKRIYSSGGSGNAYSGKTKFSATANVKADALPWYTTASVKNYAPGSNPPSTDALLSSSKHYFYGSASASLFSEPMNYSAWRDGKEYRTDAYDTNGTTLVRRVDNTWAQRAPVSWWPIYVWQNPSQDYAPTNDPRLTQTVSTLSDTNLVSKQTFVYDQYNNRTDVREYGFGSGAAGALLRHTHTDYLTTNSYNGNIDYTSSSGVHIRNLPTTVRVNDAAAATYAFAETRYDEGAYPLLTYAATVGWTNPATTARGNPTTSARWHNITGGYYNSHAQYDVLGNVRKTWDARGNLSQLIYVDAFSDGVNRNTYAFPTRTDSPVPDPSNDRATNTPLVSTSTYDFSTGQARTATDANNKTTTYEYAATDHAGYSNQLDRLTRVSLPDGGWVSYAYNPAPHVNSVNTRRNIDNTRFTDAYLSHDGLGRPYRAQQNVWTGWLITDTQYDAPGRVSMVSNPFYVPNGQSGNASNWTTTTYDALSRVKSVTTPDAAVVSTAYSGNAVTVTDQAGKKRKSVTDAFGRLTSIVEDPISGGLNYQTDYAYDVLDNLRKVTQGAQQRFFMYDSLSRLIRAKNPEQAAYGPISNVTDSVTGNNQWSFSYAYDDNSNLTGRTDARGVSMTQQYDNLNRPTWTTYSDATPGIGRRYDFATNGRGRYYADYTQGTSGSSLTISSYDQVGRVTAQSYSLYSAPHYAGGWSPGFGVGQQYDKLGNVTLVTYPSGRSQNYSYDNAGRMNASGGYLGDGVGRTYVGSTTYNAWSMREQEHFGTTTPLYHKLHYNVRGQLYDVRLSSVAWATDQWNWNRGCLQMNFGNYGWGQSGPLNNGNVTNMIHYVPADDAMSSHVVWQQNYTYDALNRLAGAADYRITSAGTTTQTGQQAYAYDRWGNRTMNTAQTWGAGIPNVAFNVDSATNRLLAPNGTMGYDAAGNLTSDGYTSYGARTYDAEGRMRTAADYNGGTSSYTYDANGHRARRKGIAGIETWQIYGVGGELLAEYAPGGAAASPQKEYGYRSGELLIVAAGNDIRWLVADQLGTPRIIANKTGSLADIRRHDYLPFGEELFAGGRTTNQGYSGNDSVRQSFTGYEKDGETGLDFAQARYYSPTQGRFTSTDPIYFEPRRVRDPQSWNLYCYVRNNPLKYVDPFGLWKQVDCSSGNGKCWEAEEGDTYKTLANEIGTWYGRFLPEFFQNQSISSGQVFDVSGFSEWAGQRDLESRLENPPQLAVGGGLRVVGGAARAGGGLLSRFWSWLRGGSQGSAFANGISREALESAAADPGSTITVVTKLTQAPKLGHQLYAWEEGSEALANQAIQQGQVYSARIPKALIETLRTSGLVRDEMTVMNGIQHKALVFRPEASEFIVRFFK